MLPWIQLDTAQIPGGGELRLKQRGTEFSIMLGSNELMNSRLSGSEEALATLAFERIADHKRPHILIGGLGMGFTLRAALAVLPQDAKVTVAELVPAVVDTAAVIAGSVAGTGSSTALVAAAVDGDGLEPGRPIRAGDAGDVDAGLRETGERGRGERTAHQ